jgi:hypothetical protein
LQGAGRWTTGIEVLPWRFLQAGVSATLSIAGHAREPELDVTSMALWLSGTPFNIAQFLKRASSFFKFSTHFLHKLQFLIGSARCFRAFQSGNFLAKKDRAAFAGGPSQGRKRPGRAATAGAIACLVLQIKKARTLTGLNFCSRFSAHASYFAGLTCRTVHPPITSGVPQRLGLTNTFVPLFPCALVSGGMRPQS